MRQLRQSNEYTKRQSAYESKLPAYATFPNVAIVVRIYLTIQVNKGERSLYTIGQERLSSLEH